MPNRIIKESICSSESINELSWFEEALFYRLIVNCDDYGRFDGRSAIIKARLLPLKDVTNKQVEDALSKIEATGMITRYNVGGKPYLQLTTWGNHQQIRTKKPKFPAPDNICNQMISNDIKCYVESNPNPIQSESEFVSESESESERTDAALSEYEKLIGPLTPRVAEVLSAYDFSQDVIIHAIRTAHDNGARHLHYIEAVLEGYVQDGVKSIADVERVNHQRKSRKKGQNQEAGARYDFDEIEKLEFERRFGKKGDNTT